MVTYSVPVLRDGEIIGVVTADLSIDYFQTLGAWIEELELGAGSYGFVVSRSGTFIYHPHTEYVLRQKVHDATGPATPRGVSSLLRGMQQRQTGTVRGVDFWKGAPVTYYYAPIPSSGWSFVAVSPATGT